MKTPRDIMWKYCKRKVGHKSKGAAEAHIRALEKLDMTSGKVRAYLCGFCKQWHVGH